MERPTRTRCRPTLCRSRLQGFVLVLSSCLCIPCQRRICVSVYSITARESIISPPPPLPLSLPSSLCSTVAFISAWFRTAEIFLEVCPDRAGHPRSAPRREKVFEFSASYVRDENAEGEFFFVCLGLLLLSRLVDEKRLPFSLLQHVRSFLSHVEFQRLPCSSICDRFLPNRALALLAPKNAYTSPLHLFYNTPAEIRSPARPLARMAV